jgi:eukaryotic-like serine/threonine-protein kinase
MIAMLGGRAWLLVTDPRPWFGWNYGQPHAAYVRTVASDGPAIGRLQIGDRLISLNGDSAIGAVGPSLYLSSLSAGDRYVLRIEREGAHRDYEFTAVSHPSNVRALIVGIVWCAVALLIAVAGPRSAGLPVAATAGVAAWFLAEGAGGRLPFQMIYPLHAVVGYHFAYRFPDRVPPRRIWTWLLLMLYAGGAVAIAMSATFNWIYLTRGPVSGTDWLARHAPILVSYQALSVTVYLAAVAGIVAVTLANYRLLTGSDERRRVRWITFSGTAGLAVNLFFAAGPVAQIFFAAERLPSFLGPTRTLGIVNSGTGAYLTVGIPITIAYAVLKYRLFDIKVVLRLGMQYLFAKRALQALIGVPVLALAYTVVSARDRTVADIALGSAGYLYWIAALGLSVGYRRPMRLWLDRRFFREQYDRDQVLGRLLEDLDEAQSTDAISQLVGEQLSVALHPKVVYLCLEDADRIALTYTSRPDVDSRPFASRGALMAYLERKGVPIDVLQRPQGLIEDDARWLHALGVHLAVPIAGHTGRVLGMLLLGEKKSEEPYSGNDRRLLQGIARQIGIAHESSHLKAQLAQEQLVRQEVLVRVDRDVANLLKECPSCGTCFDSTVESCDRDGRPLTLLPLERAVDGKYRIDRLIGRGGMGAVYEAIDIRLQRTVAIKILTGRTFGQDLAIRRFEREARAVARLKHHNIVDVYDFGILAGGGAYLVMECLGGESLRTELARAGAIPPVVAAEWFEQILQGIGAAHERGIVHRDLKPENIVGRRDDAGVLTMKIVDFGLAKLKSSDDGDSATMTQADAIVGTWGYMSPEQILGLDVDHRSDLFTAGVILVEMLTGCRPFIGSSFQQVSHAILNDAYHLPGSSPEIRRLDDALQRCLTKERQDRWDSAKTIERALLPTLRACGLMFAGASNPADAGSATI